MHVVILGAGFSGRAYGKRMSRVATSVAGTTRTAEGSARLAAAGIEPLVFDGRAISDQLAERLSRATHLVMSAAPGDDGDPFLDVAGGRDLPMPALRWAAYLSTIGVYGDHKGEWVDEKSACRPSTQRTRHRIAAEQAWLEFGAARGVPAAILRLSGIYGPGRNALANLAAGTSRRIIKPGQVFNRIHTADIAGALDFLGERELGGIYNVSDDEPSPPQDPIEFAAALMGVEPPPAIDFATADLSPMARSFYGEVKKASNRKLRQAGYDFAFPDYRQALMAMWADGSWRNE